MRVVEDVFEKCYIIEPDGRTDSRGVMQVFYSERAMNELLEGFTINEQRIYKMPKKHTFYGIHYQNLSNAQGKLISVIQGSALDYIVDLRKDSPTYRQYKVFELSENTPRLIYIAPGFGHGFLTLEDNTMQSFAIDVDFNSEHSGTINYRDPAIGLKLPVEDVVISDYDRDAPFT